MKTELILEQNAQALVISGQWDINKKFKSFRVFLWSGKRNGDGNTQRLAWEREQINSFKASGLLFSPVDIKGLYGSAVLVACLHAMISSLCLGVCLSVLPAEVLIWVTLSEQVAVKSNF